jgi:hypothetical protein
LIWGSGSQPTGKPRLKTDEKIADEQEKAAVDEIPHFNRTAQGLALPVCARLF